MDNDLEATHTAPSSKPVHIRPRVRNRKQSAASTVTQVSTTPPEEDGNGQQTQPPNQTSTVSSPANSLPAATKGILKTTPKYTKQLVQAAAATTAEATSLENNSDEEDDEHDATRAGSLPTPEPAVKEFIVERKVGRRRNKKKKHNPQPAVTAGQGASSAVSAAHAIEGYVPRQGGTAVQGNAAADDDEFVFNSLADLMSKAGTLPDEQDHASMQEEGTLVEADLKFSVMSPEEFDETIRQQEEGEADHVVADAVDAEANPADQEENENRSDDEDDDSEKENSDDGSSFWDLLGGDSDDDEEPAETRPERAFMQLWKALSQWVTPQAVEYVVRQQETNNNIGNGAVRSNNDGSDVESTRCAGLMSLLQLYLGSCLQDELHRPMDERREVELRLGQLIRCFSYRQPSPKLDASQARALTCILMQMVQPNYQKSGVGVDSVPPSCQAIGLTSEECNYLIRSAIVSFEQSATTATTTL